MYNVYIYNYIYIQRERESTKTFFNVTSFHCFISIQQEFSTTQQPGCPSSRLLVAIGPETWLGLSVNEHSYGKSPCVIGQSSYTWAICNSYVHDFIYWFNVGLPEGIE